MKQCPNPNCIFYTRLEELPDAYIKCPGCGGMLAGAEQAPGSGQPQPQVFQPSAGYTLPPDDPFARPEQAYAYTAPHPQAAPPLYSPGPRAGTAGNPYTSNPYSQPQPDPYPQEYADADPYAGSPPGAGGTAQRPSWPLSSRLIVGASVLLLIAACVIVAMLMSDRLFPRALVITAPQATETAIAALRPAVNTPIIIMPTSAAGGAAVTPILAPTRQQENPPTPQALPPSPTPLPLPTFDASPNQLPTPAPAQPTAPPLVAATAPPAQAQPQGGVINAQMSVSLEGGEPAGSVSAYGPTDAFNLAVQANYGPGAVSSVVTRWYGPDGNRIYEMRRDYTQSGVYYAGFTLRTSASWQPGTYRVDIHTNDSPLPAYTVSFTVIP